MGEERGYQVAEEGLAVRGFAAQVAVLEGAAGHGLEGAGVGEMEEEDFEGAEVGD